MSLTLAFPSKWFAFIKRWARVVLQSEYCCLEWWVFDTARRQQFFPLYLLLLFSLFALYTWRVFSSVYLHKCIYSTCCIWICCVSFHNFFCFHNDAAHSSAMKNVLAKYLIYPTCRMRILHSILDSHFVVVIVPVLRLALCDIHKHAHAFIYLIECIALSCRNNNV